MYHPRCAPLYLALLPTAIIAAGLLGVFAIVAHDQHLPLLSEVPVTFVLGASVFTYLVALVSYAYDTPYVAPPSPREVAYREYAKAQAECNDVDCAWMCPHASARLNRTHGRITFTQAEIERWN